MQDTGKYGEHHAVGASSTNSELTLSCARRGGKSCSLEDVSGWRAPSALSARSTVFLEQCRWSEGFAVASQPMWLSVQLPVALPLGAPLGVVMLGVMVRPYASRTRALVACLFSLGFGHELLVALSGQDHFGRLSPESPCAVSRPKQAWSSEPCANFYRDSSEAGVEACCIHSWCFDHPLYPTSKVEIQSGRKIVVFLWNQVLEQTKFCKETVLSFWKLVLLCAKKISTGIKFLRRTLHCFYAV